MIAEYGSYTNYLKSERWMKQKRDVCDLFSNKCCFCQSTHNLHVHHKKYSKQSMSGNCGLRKRAKQLIVVCRVCHIKIHELAKTEQISVFHATRKYKETYYPKTKMWFSKREIKEFERRPS